MYDNIGTARGLLDASGTATDWYELDTFGRPMSSSGTTPNPYRYGGAWGYISDPSGMLQLGERFYYPELGRFVSQDPIRDGGNWYAYVANNPIRSVDPTGLSSMGGAGSSCSPKQPCPKKKDCDKDYERDKRACAQQHDAGWGHGVESVIVGAGIGAGIGALGGAIAGCIGGPIGEAVTVPGGTAGGAVVGALGGLGSYLEDVYQYEKCMAKAFWKYIQCKGGPLAVMNNAMANNPAMSNPQAYWPSAGSY